LTDLPTTGRPRGKTNEQWSFVGTFHSEEEMQAARLSERVSKRKVGARA